MDLSGNRYGRLLVLTAGPRKGPHHRPTWHCRCECGTAIMVYQSNLLNSHQKSCGCLRREIAKTKRAQELTGEKFGRLLVLGRGRHMKTVATWLCQCDCGQTVTVRTYCLTSGMTQSCGCLKRETTSQRSLHDLTGKTFDRWTVICRGPNHEHHTQWVCTCVCGKVGIVDAHHLTSGWSKSCGCLKSTHQVADHELLLLKSTRHSWGAAKQRCSNPNAPGYAYYGGRGITFSPRWNRLKDFIADVGLKPSLQHSLDRYPNPDGHYEPGNVRWATKQEQAQNRRTAIRQFMPPKDPFTGRFSLDVTSPSPSA